MEANGQKVRTVLAMVLEPDRDDILPGVWGGSATGHAEVTKARVTAIAFACGTLRVEADRVSIEMDVVRSHTVREAQPHMSQIGAERDLLAEVATMAGECQDPLLVTWGGDAFALPFIRFRGFACGIPTNWISPSTSGADDGWRRGQHIDLQRELCLDRLQLPLEQALLSFGARPITGLAGMERLEILAAGTFVLACRMLGHSGLMTGAQYSGTVSAYSKRLNELSAEKPHLGAWLLASFNAQVIRGVQG